MTKANIEDKKMFLIASAVQERIKWLQEIIEKHISRASVFTARDGLDAAAKLQNAPPHVVITDIELPKTKPMKLVEHAMNVRGAESTAIIVCGPLPTEGEYLDEMVTGKISYFHNENDESEFLKCLMKALNFSSQSTQADFHIKFLAPGELLLKEGDKADYVYFVKKGQLKAFKGSGEEEKEIGLIAVGEFVGEMAYINGEPRSASVKAVTDCELIEVAVGTFDSVLFKRPAWSKALMMTLSKRVKAANQTKVS